MPHDCLLIVSWSREAYGPSFKHPEEPWSTQSCGWFALGSLLFPHPLSHPQAFREEGGGSHTQISLRGWEQIHLSTLTKGALPKMTVRIKLWPSPVVSLMPWHARAFICLWLKMKALFCWCKREISWCVRLWYQASPCHVIFRALQGGSYSLEADIPTPPDYF